MTNVSIPKYTARDVATLLAQNVGIEKALDVVTRAAAELGIPAVMTREQCLVVLERVSAEPGLVGIAARFAKSRAILKLT